MTPGQQRQSNGDDNPPMSMTTGSVPVPDPTRLTTQLVDRALGGFREVVDTEKKVTDTRLNAIDQATKLNADKVDQQREVLREDIDRAALAMRELIESKINGLRDLTEEKFKGIDSRFVERDVRTDQAAQESRISLGAALAAAKEAVSEQNAANAKAIAKSEEATQKQIDSLVTLTQTSNKALEDKIGDLKGRMDRGEGAIVQAVQSRTEGRDVRTDSRAGLAVLLSALFGVVGIVGLVIGITSGGG